MRASRRLSWASLRLSVQGCTHDIEALIPASHKYEAAGSEPAGLMPDPQVDGRPAKLQVHRVRPV
jgi:hypothetical protein